LCLVSPDVLPINSGEGYVLQWTQRASNGESLLRGEADHSREKEMPQRVNSLAPILVVFLGATVAAGFVSPVWAESACIEQPGQKGAEGTHWSARYDRAQGRKCWFLLDANGRDVTALAATPAPADSLSSRIASWLDSLMPQASPQGDGAQTPSPRPSLKPRGNAANAGGPDNAARGEHKGAGEGRSAVKRVPPVLTEPEHEALFEAFLRWQEIQRTTGASSSP